MLILILTIKNLYKAIGPEIWQGDFVLILILTIKNLYKAIQTHKIGIYNHFPSFWAVYSLESLLARQQGKIYPQV